MILSDVAFVPYLIAGVSIVASPAFWFARKFRRAAAERYNLAVRCGHCGRDVVSEADLYLFDGYYVCPECSTILRRRLAAVAKIAVIGIGAMVLLGPGVLILDALMRGDGWWTPARIVCVTAPPAVFSLTGLRSIRRLKAANKAAAVGAAQSANRYLNASAMPPELSTMR